MRSRRFLSDMLVQWQQGRQRSPPSGNGTNGVGMPRKRTTMHDGSRGVSWLGPMQFTSSSLKLFRRKIASRCGLKQKIKVRRKELGLEKSVTSSLSSQRPWTPVRP